MNFLSHLSLFGRALVCAGLLSVTVLNLHAQDAAKPSEADAAWTTLQEAIKPPAYPESWRTTPPTQADQAAFRLKVGEAALVAADKVREFHQKYPDFSKITEARNKEIELLRTCIHAGYTNSFPRFISAALERAKDPALTENDKFTLSFQALQIKAQSLMPEGQEAVMKEFEKGARELIVQFPSRPEPYQYLLIIANDADDTRKRALAEEVKNMPNVPEAAKGSAQKILDRMDAIGKPVVLKDTAIDGREVDLANMKGKVVLIDFWATWCGPCIAELPKVKAAYEKLHPKGFEIIGISFDEDKERLVTMLKDENMTWPQLFDGQGWNNKYAKEFGIGAIPAMWLIDKKGNLRDLDVRGGLAEKVEKLLAEE